FEFQYPEKNNPSDGFPPFGIIAAIVLIPLLLILLNTFTTMAVNNETLQSSMMTDILIFAGHPFSALIIATLVAIYFLGMKRGMSKEKILDLSTKALGP